MSAVILDKVRQTFWWSETLVLDTTNGRYTLARKSKKVSQRDQVFRYARNHRVFRHE